MASSCGRPEAHEYEFYLAIENIDHTRTKARSPQTNGIAERFHKTLLDEFYRIAFRKRLYGSIAELQGDLDDWLQIGMNTRDLQTVIETGLGKPGQADIGSSRLRTPMMSVSVPRLLALIALRLRSCRRNSCVGVGRLFFGKRLT